MKIFSVVRACVFVKGHHGPYTNNSDAIHLVTYHQALKWHGFFVPTKCAISGGRGRKGGPRGFPGHPISRMTKTSAFLTNAQSGFVIFIDGLLGPPRLAQHNRR